jgi:hypothetical protein
MNREEDLFPTELKNKAIRSGGYAYGWKMEDIPEVVKTCRKLGLAVGGCRTEFYFPDATCELYWLNVYSKPRKWYETWGRYVERSCSEFLVLFSELINKTDFLVEALDWEVIRRKQESGVKIFDYLCFEIDPILKKKKLL